MIKTCKSICKRVNSLSVIKKLKKMIKSLIQNLIKRGDGHSTNKNPEPEPVQAEETPVSQENPSPNLKGVVVLADDPSKLDLDELQKMLQEALSGRKGSQQKSPTPYILNTDSDSWYWNPIDRNMIRLPAGAQLVLAEETPNDEGKIICLTDLGFALIPFELIIPLGYN